MPPWPQGLDPQAFDAFHDNADAWRPGMEALVRAQGWQGEWRAAGDGTVLVALLGRAEVLKLYPPFLRDHWAFEGGLMPRLQGRLSVPTPRLLARGEVQGWPWTRMDMLPGRLLQEVWPQWDEAQRVALLHRLGTLIREVHSLPVGDQTRWALPWTEFLAQRRATVEARQKRTGLPDHLLAGLSRFLEGPLPQGPHVLLTGEYTPMNLLVDEQGALSGMFDFGDGLVGPAAYDWLGPFTFLAAARPARVRALRDGLGLAATDPEALMRLLLLHRYSCLPIQLRDVPDWTQAPDLSTLARRLFEGA